MKKYLYLIIAFASGIYALFSFFSTTHSLLFGFIKPAPGLGTLTLLIISALVFGAKFSAAQKEDDENGNKKSLIIKIITFVIRAVPVFVLLFILYVMFVLSQF